MASWTVPRPTKTLKRRRARNEEAGIGDEVRIDAKGTPVPKTGLSAAKRNVARVSVVGDSVFAS